MKTLELNAELRENMGKTQSKKLRAQGKLPAVLYGLGESEHLVVSAKEFDTLIFTPESHIVVLNINGEKKEAIIKEVQYHPVKDHVLHIDFLRVNDEKPIDIRIPVKIIGLSEGVKEGGKLQLLSRYLKVRGLKANLPDFLEVDVTKVRLGQSIQVAQVSFENLEILDTPNAVIAAVKLTRAAKGSLTAASATDAKTAKPEAAE